MSEMMVCFTCCVTPQPPRKRPRIDRSMIGNPTDFRHTGHIGSGELSVEGTSNGHLTAVQSQMQSKGGYDHITDVSIELNVMDLPAAAKAES